MKAKKIASLLLAFTIVATSLIACSKEGEKTNTIENNSLSSDNVSRFNEPGKFPIIKEKVNLTIGVSQDTNIEDRKTNLYTKKLEENVNVNLTFEEFPAKEAAQKLSILISSNSKLPDMINMVLTDIETYTYGSGGYFIELDDYIKNSSYYLKNNMDLDKYMKYIRSADGKIYGMPRLIEEIGNDWSNRHWINKTWLEKLNLKMPTTTDEYYNVLKAFKEKDPNGNGKRDEIPLIGSTNSWNGTIWPTLMNAFIYSNSAGDYILAENGKLSVAYNQDGWKQGLEYMNKLCKEELLSPLTFTQDVNQLKTILEDKDAQLVGSIAAGSMSIYQPASKRKQDMTHIVPLKGPSGKGYATLSTASLPLYCGYITSSCKDPEAAFKVFDYMYDTEMALHGRFGAKDVDYKQPEAGKGIGLYEKLLGYKPCIEYINPIWGTLQNSHWNEVHSTYRSYEMSGGQLWNNDPFDSQYMTSLAVPDYMNKADDETVLRIIYLPEEIDEIAEIKATLTTYRDEMTVAFITGNKPLSEWESYVKELETIGLSKFLEISQKAYDRMNQK